jgi:hypothetical protein
MLFVLDRMLRLSVIAIISGFGGVTPVARQMAGFWTKRAIDGGFPYLWEVQLLAIFYWLAICTVLVGWVILLFTGAFTLDLLIKWIF